MSSLLFDELFDVMHFPAGEPHVTLRKRPEMGVPTIICPDIRDFNGLMEIIIGNEILERNGFIAEWVIPYFPFGRQDRRNSIYDGQELFLAMHLMKGLNVTIFDPHSDVSGLFPHITQRQIVSFYSTAGLFDADDYVVAIPDAGAIKKADTWLSGRTSVQCLKKRDTSTGKLSGFEVLADDLTGKTVIIVDDICDAGGTFLGLASVLKERGASECRLAVTHGLFTKGLDNLMDAFEKIYTLDTCKLSHPRLTKVSTQYITRSCTPL